MPYRIRYELSVDFVPAGVGLGIQASPQGSPGGRQVPAGNAQTLTFFNSSGGANPPNSNTFTGSDVTALLAAMSTDLSTQMNAALGRVQGFASGGG